MSLVCVCVVVLKIVYDVRTLVRTQNTYVCTYVRVRIVATNDNRQETRDKRPVSCFLQKEGLHSLVFRNFKQCNDNCNHHVITFLTLQERPSRVIIIHHSSSSSSSSHTHTHTTYTVPFAHTLRLQYSTYLKKGFVRCPWDHTRGKLWLNAPTKQRTC